MTKLLAWINLMRKDLHSLLVNHIYVLIMSYKCVEAHFLMAMCMRVKQVMEKSEYVPGPRSVGSGSDQGGSVVRCLWGWLPVTVNLSL